MLDPRIFDADPADVPVVRILRQSTRKAVKGRKCDCGKWMPPGTRYDDIAGTEDGEFFKSVRCVRGECPNIAPVKCKRCNGGGKDPEFGQEFSDTGKIPDLCHDCNGRGTIPGDL